VLQLETTKSWIILIAGAVLLLALFVMDFLNFTVDDVFITLRYAHNNAAGLGPVYNPGEFVEGYSNWLWMQLLSGFALLKQTGVLSALDLMWTAKFASLFFGLASLAAVFALTQELLPSMQHARWPAAFAMLLTAGNAFFAAWSIGGMETILNAFLFTVAGLAALRMARTKRGELSFTLYAVLLGASFAAASLTRPEPVLHAAAGIAMLWLLLPRERRMRGVLFSGTTFAVLYAAFLAWRVVTYGDILPNTFYAKTGGGLFVYVYGVKYTAAAIGAAGGAALIVLPAAFLRSVAERRRVWYLAVLIGCSVFFSVYSGGDWMPGYRFLVPVIPLFAALGGAGAATLLSSLAKHAEGRLLRTWTTAVALLLVVLAAGMMQRDLIRGQIPYMKTGMKDVSGHALPYKSAVAGWLQRSVPPDAAIATGEAGIIGYANPRLRVIDCNGLIDAHLARRSRQGLPFDTDYVLDQEPAAVVLLRAEIDEFLRAAGSNDYETALRSSLRFQRSYRLATQIGDLDVYVREDRKKL